MIDVRRSRTVAGLRQDVARLRRLVVPRNPAPSPAPVVDRRPAMVQDYLSTHDVRKLQIGAGKTLLDGWLCTDLHPSRPETLRLDATRRFPFPDACLDFVLAEHVIEHVRYRAGQRMLRECWRTLRPGGVLRVATPDLARIVAMYLGQAGPEGESYKRWSLARHLSRRPNDHAAFVLNHHLRAWGHTFLYDGDVLPAALAEAGFADIEPRAFGESSYPELRDIERHGREGGARRRAAIRFETMIFEARKPS